MKSNYFETILGIVVLVIAINFLLDFLKVNKTNDFKQSQMLSAKFLKLGGIIVGNDVKLSGVKVGSVSKVFLDKNYLAVVEFYIDKEIKLPKDSKVKVNSEGILGNKYLSLMPGTEKDILLEGEELKDVVDYESIEDQVSKIIFLATQ